MIKDTALEGTILLPPPTSNGPQTNAPPSAPFTPLPPAPPTAPSMPVAPPLAPNILQGVGLMLNSPGLFEQIQFC